MNKNSTNIVQREGNNTFIPQEGNRFISIDFNQIYREIKPLHGINNSPVTFGAPLPELLEAGIPYVRLASRHRRSLWTKSLCGHSEYFP